MSETSSVGAGGGAGNPVASEADSGEMHNFSIKKIDLTAFSTWAIKQELCGICRNSISEPSIQYSSDQNDKNGLTICIGQCNHAYHLDCIQRWCKTRSVCPLCTQEWNWEGCSMEKINGYS